MTTRKMMRGYEMLFTTLFFMSFFNFLHKLWIWMNPKQSMLFWKMWINSKLDLYHKNRIWFSLLCVPWLPGTVYYFLTILKRHVYTLETRVHMTNSTRSIESILKMKWTIDDDFFPDAAPEPANPEKRRLLAFSSTLI